HANFTGWRDHGYRICQFGRGFVCEARVHLPQYVNVAALLSGELLKVRSIVSQVDITEPKLATFFGAEVRIEYTDMTFRRALAATNHPAGIFEVDCHHPTPICSETARSANSNSKS